jgi:hypothetical protein
VHAVGDRSTPSKATVAPESTLKPDPTTVNELPAGPCAGVTVIPTGVTVKDPLAVFPPRFVATTEVPDVPDGTLKGHVKPPELSATRLPLFKQLVIVLLSKTRPTVLSAENPVPVTVTDAPTGPCPGATVITSEVTVNVTEFEWPKVAVSSATTA